MWNQFAAARGSARLDRRWLAPMIQAGALDLTAAKNPKGDLLALQATYLHCQRARQLMVVSPFRSNPDIATRKGIHRANCLLHWDAMLRMKEQGIRYFDFGGWYPGKTDITLLGMNAFKESFGGTVARDYQCQKILTAKGWVVLTAARMLGKTKWPNANGEPDSEFKPDENPKQGKLSPALR